MLHLPREVNAAFPLYGSYFYTAPVCCMYNRLSAGMYVSMSVCLSVCLCACPLACHTACLTICLSVGLPTYLPDCIYVCLRMCCLLPHVSPCRKVCGQGLAQDHELVPDHGLVHEISGCLFKSVIFHKSN